MYKIAIVAESDFILAFKAVGVDAYRVEDDNMARILKAQCNSGKYAVVLISEHVFETIPEVIREYDEKPLPAITILPISKTRKNLGYELMRDTCIKATGTDVLSKL
ncbi:MAG: V-type ATP synthase subunit F [Vulcanimicrobiota bacterium]